MVDWNCCGKTQFLFMKTFTQKKEETTKIKEKLAKSKLIIFTTFALKGEKGLGVKQMQDLKKNLKATDSEYCVQKKTLVGRVLKQLGKEADLYAQEGSMGVVYGYGDEQSAAKTVYNFIKKNPALRMFGGFFHSDFWSEKQLTELAKLPGKDVLIGRFMGLVKYPLSALASVLGQIAKTK